MRVTVRNPPELWVELRHATGRHLVTIHGRVANLASGRSDRCDVFEVAGLGGWAFARSSVASVVLPGGLRRIVAVAGAVESVPAGPGFAGVAAKPVRAGRADPVVRASVSGAGVRVAWAAAARAVRGVAVHVYIETCGALPSLVSSGRGARTGRSGVACVLRRLTVLHMLPSWRRAWSCRFRPPRTPGCRCAAGPFLPACAVSALGVAAGCGR